MRSRRRPPSQACVVIGNISSWAASQTPQFLRSSPIHSALRNPMQTALIVAFLASASLATSAIRRVATLDFALTPQPAASVSWQSPGVRVWVNLSSKVYHCPGTRYYGATKRGEFMAEADAEKTGSRPANGRKCSPEESISILCRESPQPSDSVRRQRAQRAADRVQRMQRCG